MNMKPENKSNNSFKFIIMIALVLLAGYLYLNQNGQGLDLTAFMKQQGQVLGPTVSQSYTSNTTTVTTVAPGNTRNDYASIISGSCVNGKYLITYYMKDNTVITQEAKC